MNGYIYIIINEINHKVYIGQTNNIKRRITEHFKLLNSNKHYNTHLQNSFNIYGINNFKFKKLEVCSLEKLDEKEMQWIAFFRSNNDHYGYNNDNGGRSQRGKNNYFFGKKLIGEKNAFYGKKHTEETRRLMVKSHHKTKLTDAQVEEIIIFLLCTESSATDLSKKYKVPNSLISKIKNNKARVFVRPELRGILSEIDMLERRGRRKRRNKAI